MNKTIRPFLFGGMLTVYFLFLAYQILQSDYVMTDAAWSFWHTPDHHTNLDFWVPQGRLFTGYMQQWLFGWAGKIANLKYIRLLSWAGWVGCTILLASVLRRIRRSANAVPGSKGIAFDDSMIQLTTAYFASAFFTLIAISWTVCMQIFIPTLLALAAGLLLFDRLMKRDEGNMKQDGGGLKRDERIMKPDEGIMKRGDGIKIPLWAIGLFLVLGVTALFFYQTCYPLLLIPFYSLYLSRKDGKFTAPMRAGLLYFFIGLVVYYFLFEYSLRAMGMSASPRTAFRFNPLDRLSFFFSPPMNQAFNVNILFNTGNPVSQAVFPTLFAAWLFFEFRYRKGKWQVKLRYVLGLLVWWMLGYLPTLISQEIFGPYRSMPVLGLMVFMMIADVLLFLIKDGRRRQVLALSLVFVFLFWGGLVYYTYLAHPLREEYRAVRKEVVDRYTAHTREVIFVCADEDGFNKKFGVRHYKDELGLPSTYKDWTPEPLVKQIVYELTGDRQQAEGLKVSVYAKASEIPDKTVLGHDDVLFIDAHTLF